MSQENVELVLDATRRFQAEDWAGYAPLLDPAARMTGAEGWPEPGPFIGRADIVAQYEGVMAHWAQARVTDFEVVADIGDWVVVEYQFHARGLESGIEANFQMATATRVKDSHIIETHWRWNRGAALKAAGLSE